VLICVQPNIVTGVDTNIGNTVFVTFTSIGSGQGIDREVLEWDYIFDEQLFQETISFRQSLTWS